MKDSTTFFAKLELEVELQDLREEFLKVRSQVRRYEHPLGAGSNFALSLVSSTGDDQTILPFSRGANFSPTKLAKQTPKTMRLIRSLRGKLFSVRYLTSRPESGLLFHRDYDVNFSFGIIRLHVPLFTDESAKFAVEKTTFYVPPGAVYYVDVSKIHATKNASMTERVHLVIDVGLTKELVELFPREFIARKKRECEFRYYPKVLGTMERRVQLKKLETGFFQLPNSLRPECLKADSTETIEITTSRFRTFLLAPGGTRFEIHPFNKNWFFCPNIGPGFVFRTDRSGLRVEIAGRPVADKKHGTKLVRVRGTCARAAR